MPCDSSGMGPVDYGYDVNQLKRKLAMVEAILCGLIRSSWVGPQHDHNLKLLFARVDWQEAGVTPEQAFAWWQEHLLKDREREKVCRWKKAPFEQYYAACGRKAFHHYLDVFEDNKCPDCKRPIEKEK